MLITEVEGRASGQSSKAINYDRQHHFAASLEDDAIRKRYIFNDDSGDAPAEGR